MSKSDPKQAKHPQAQDAVELEALRSYFIETIARYTNTPRIPELGAVLARYTNRLLTSARLDSAIEELTQALLSGSKPEFPRDMLSVCTFIVKRLEQLQAERNKIGGK